LRLIVVYLFILFLSNNLVAQNLDLGKVTIKELEEKEHPIEKNAAAAVLFDVGKTHFIYKIENGYGFPEITVNVSTKIKIYKKEGFSYGNFEIPIYVGESDKENITFSNAYTYNLVDGKIEKTKLKSDGEVIEQIDNYFSKVRISMPDVKEGSIIEYSYTLKSLYFSSLNEWYFQKRIPVNYSKFETFIPEFYLFDVLSKGSITPKITRSEKIRTITYIPNQQSKNNSWSAGISYKNMDYKELNSVYVEENVPSIKEDSFVDNSMNYASSVSHVLTALKYPNSPLKNSSYSWTDVGRKVYKSTCFGDELDKTDYFKNDLDAVLQGKVTSDEKILAILEFVKRQVKWNNKNSVYCNDGVQTAYKNGEGNVAEINLMLTAMLRYAGLEANPILVSTTANGIPMYPSRSAFNYVITAVEVPDAIVLLDATDANSSLNILPTRVLNWEGRLIRKEGASTFVPLRPKVVSKEAITCLFAIMNDGSVNGRVRTQYADYYAFKFRDRFNNVSKDNYVESLEKKFSNIEIEDYTVANEQDLSKPITEEFKFNHPSMAEIIGDKIYVSPFLFYATTENPFKMETREYPIDFVYPQEDKYKITIDIPEGYTIESLPKPVSVALANSQLVYQFNAQVVGSNIQLTATLSINESFITPVYYNDIKEFFAKVVENQMDKIVLKKIK